MNRLSIPMLVVVSAAGLLMAGCSQGAPVPTQAPKAAEPTKAAAPAAQPTAASAAPTTAPAAKKVDYPQKGKAISMIVPVAAGGDTDVGFRLLVSAMEKEVGTNIEVVNKVGAGGQVGITELAKSKADGYTMGVTFIPTGITMYLDPDRKAVFSRKDFIPVGNHVVEPVVVGVKADSPYKTMKDLIDGAKAKPDKVTVGFTGLLGQQHLATLLLEKQTGTKFAVVPFDGSAPALSALLGGHIDVQMASASLFMSQIKSGDIRVLGVMDKEESKFLPGAKTLEAQGYPVNMSAWRMLSVPAGTPQEIVDVLSSAMKKAMSTEEHQKKATDVALSLRYLDTAQCLKLWADMEEEVKPIMELAKQQR